MGDTNDDASARTATPGRPRRGLDIVKAMPREWTDGQRWAELVRHYPVGPLDLRGVCPEPQKGTVVKPFEEIAKEVRARPGSEERIAKLRAEIEAGVDAEGVVYDADGSPVRRAHQSTVFFPEELDEELLIEEDQ